MAYKLFFDHYLRTTGLYPAFVSFQFLADGDCPNELDELLSF